MRLGDEPGDAALAIEAALTPTEKAWILAKFRYSSLNGADVADILDILHNTDALLELREPFYEDGTHVTLRNRLGWQDESVRWQANLIGIAVLCVAILTDKVPTENAVADLIHRAIEGLVP